MHAVGRSTLQATCRLKSLGERVDANRDRSLPIDGWKSKDSKGSSVTIERFHKPVEQMVD